MGCLKFYKFPSVVYVADDDNDFPLWILLTISDDFVSDSDANCVHLFNIVLQKWY